MDFNRLVLLAPLGLQFGAQPISQETNPNMIAYTIWSPVKHRAHSQVILQVTKGILYFQEALVVADHARTGDLLGGGIGCQQIKTVADRLGADQFAAAAPLEFALLI